MEGYFIRSLFILQFIPMIFCTPVKLNDQIDKHINIRLVEESISSRVKRSANDTIFPDSLVFDIPTSRSDARLKLTRRPLIPTFTKDDQLLDALENAAVYIDHLTKSAMIVKKEAEDYKLKGNFHHDGQNWELRPLSINTHSTKSHQVGPLRVKDKEQIISFEGDEVLLNDTESALEGSIKKKLVSSLPLSVQA